MSFMIYSDGLQYRLSGYLFIIIYIHVNYFFSYLISPLAGIAPGDSSGKSSFPLTPSFAREKS
jgi:hypothetical protein